MRLPGANDKSKVTLMYAKKGRNERQTREEIIIIVMRHESEIRKQLNNFIRKKERKN